MSEDQECKKLLIQYMKDRIKEMKKLRKDLRKKYMFKRKHSITTKISFLMKILLLFLPKRSSFDYETIGGVTYFTEIDFKVFKGLIYISDIRHTIK